MLLDVNKVSYFKKALHLLIPKDTVKQGGDVPFTDDDIKKMISSTTSKRNIALIHFFASIGGRPAVLYDPVLRFKNVYPMRNGCKAVLLYSDSKEEYYAFLTPEASRFLDDYRDKINQNCEASSEFLNEIGTNEMRSNEVAKQRVDS